MVSQSCSTDTLNKNGMSRHRPTTFECIQHAVSSLPDDTSLCTNVVHDGVRVQLVYENFVLCRIYRETGDCREITERVISCVPNFIENDYLHSACNGDFDLSGTLWAPEPAFVAINRFRQQSGSSAYNDTLTIVEDHLNGLYDTIKAGGWFLFTPTWSATLIGRSLFATYEDFLDVMASDFLVPDHITTTTRTMHHVVDLFKPERDNQYTITQESVMQHHTPGSPQNLLISNNDLSRIVGPLAHKPTNQVSLFKMDRESSFAQIKNINIEPDRFGRLHPKIYFDNFSIRSEWPIEIPLNTIDDLLREDYRVGDVVEIKFVGVIPHIGRVLLREEDPKFDDKKQTINHELGLWHAMECVWCHGPLTQKHVSLYCDNPSCDLVNYARVQYACSPGSLDLPIHPHGLNYICSHVINPTETPIIDVLNLGRAELSEIVEDDCVDEALAMLNNRHCLLHGNGHPIEIQALAQRKFLDALSLQGLYRTNVDHLQKQLMEQRYRWQDLHHVLTDPRILTRYGVSPRDARDIAQAAMLRSEEVQAFSRY